MDIRMVVSNVDRLGSIQRDPVTKWLPIAIKANDLLGYVLGNTTDLSDNDIIEGYQIACSCGNIRMLRRLVEPNW
jgi:hypothetical protein